MLVREYSDSLQRYILSDLIPFLTMHELKQLVYNSLQKFPVCSEEARILAHNIHDVGRYNGLVVLPSFLLTQA